MRKIICFKKSNNTFRGLNPFYKYTYDDVSIPGAVIRTIYCPLFKSSKAENVYLKRIAPLLSDGVLLESDIVFESLQIAKIKNSLEDTLNKNIVKLILSVYKNKPVNIVIKDEKYLPYISAIINRIEPTIISECGNTEYISNYLLDEYGISANIKTRLSPNAICGRLSVFMPGTNPPSACGKNAVLNLSGKECLGSMTENNIIYRLPPGYEVLKTSLDNNVRKIFSVLEYLSVKTENLSMVIKPDGFW